MSHGITATDKLLLVMEKAWHGLGTVVTEAPTPVEACKMAGLNWDVKQAPCLWTPPGNLAGVPSPIRSHVVNYRSDTQEVLGVVGKGYKPVQNLELAEFAEMLAEQGDKVRIATAGSIKAGRRVWFCIPGVCFSVTPKDELGTFLQVANGHDGGFMLTQYWTSIRVVCANTFQFSLMDAKRRVRFRHEGDIKAKVEEAKRALGLYKASALSYEEACKTLAAKKLTKSEAESFILDSMQFTEKKIPTAEQAKTSKRAATKRDRCMEIYQQIVKNFEEDCEAVSHRSAWNLFNGVTQWQQHQRAVRGKDEKAKTENRVFADIFGDIGWQKGRVFNRALEMAGAA